MAFSPPSTGNDPSDSAEAAHADQVVLEVDISDSPSTNVPSTQTAASTLSTTSPQEDGGSDETESENEGESSDDLHNSDPSTDGLTSGPVMPEEAFTELLQSMNRLTLNRLNLEEYDRGERRLIDEERCRRKALNGAFQPLTLSAFERKKKKQARKNRKRSAKAEYDGKHLHEHLVEAVEEAEDDSDDGVPAYDLVYDADLGDATPRVHYGNRENKALFFCYTCQPTRRQQDQQKAVQSVKKIPRVWTSSVVFTEYWVLSSSSSSSHTTTSMTTTTTDPSRYKILLHSQKCRCCERYIKPKLLTKKFVQKTLSAFDLWTGKRDRIQGESEGGGMDPIRSAGPHDSTRCHGCEIGKCRRVDQSDLTRTRPRRR